jgi:hypothetical protein
MLLEILSQKRVVSGIFYCADKCRQMQGVSPETIIGKGIYLNGDGLKNRRASGKKPSFLILCTNRYQRHKVTARFFITKKK